MVARLSQELIDFFYPVGSYYETSNTSFDPNIAWGGTWEEDSAGRDTIAYDSTQAEFNSVGKTGGSKYLQKHQHTEYVNSGSGGRYPYTLSNGGGPSTTGNFFQNNSIFGNFTGPQVLTGESGTGNSGNLQPYVVVKRWHRTA